MGTFSYFPLPGSGERPGQSFSCECASSTRCRSSSSPGTASRCTATTFQPFSFFDAPSYQPKKGRKRQQQYGGGYSTW